MRLWRAVPLVLVGLVAAGCTSGGGSSSSTPSPSGSAGASGSAQAGTPTPSAAAALPTGCESLLPFTDLDQALGRPLFGESSFIKGVAQPSIGRIGRVTCRYGLARGGRGVAPIEVGVSTYKDAESATRRIEQTVAAARGQGSTQGQATVSGVPATLLGAREAVTLVLAQGSRTVAVTLQRTLAPSLGRGINLNHAVTSVTERVLANLEM
ncbi:MAG TPA: hypothetical protein VEL73_02320 [Mycobacteriales bacterium]|nr:hypothetical protein [Mycobacteriales bacterium]